VRPLAVVPHIGALREELDEINCHGPPLCPWTCAS